MAWSRLRCKLCHGTSERSWLGFCCFAFCYGKHSRNWIRVLWFMFYTFCSSIFYYFWCSWCFHCFYCFTAQYFPLLSDAWIMDFKITMFPHFIIKCYIRKLKSERINQQSIMTRKQSFLLREGYRTSKECLGMLIWLRLIYDQMFTEISLLVSFTCKSSHGWNLINIEDNFNITIVKRQSIINLTKPQRSHLKLLKTNVVCFPLSNITKSSLYIVN